MNKVVAIINTEAKSVKPTATERMTDTLAEFMDDAIVIETVGKQLVDRISDALIDAPDLLIVLGGDGTVGCALSNAIGTTTRVLPLPGGTMNWLSKRLHGNETKWKPILRACLEGGKQRELPAGKMGDHFFFVAAMAGQMATFVEAREALRDGAMISAAKALVDNETLTTTTHLTARKEGDPRPCVNAGAVLENDKIDRFKVAAINPGSPLDLTALAIDTLINGWEEATEIERWEAAELIIEDSDGRPISVTLDGEFFEVGPKVCFSLHEATVSVLAAK